ncbi:hypothetical protein GZH49_36365 [Nocardia terpenica]|uniref:DUF5994 family protein n=1 Tax=Nocardia terpenica TaxID=455432 RepID=UPI002FE26152
MSALRMHRNPARHRVPPDFTPRLKLRPKADSEEYIDGAWWPRSGTLTAELPDLMTVLAVRLGPIQRVVYDRASWSRVPRQLAVADRMVQLDAYPFEAGNTMYVYGSNGHMIVLRVIASTTNHHTAHSILMATITDR